MFKLISILVVLINAHVNCNPFDAHLNESLLLSKWHLFKQTHHLKSSSHELDLKEFNNFKANYLKVLEHNNGQMKHTYNTRLNQISSLSYHEYLNKYLSKMSSDDLNKMASVVADSQLNVPSPSLSLDLKTRVIPNNFDWRTYGLVSTVKTQSTCGNERH
jgi:C1A family cysteine protease